MLEFYLEAPPEFWQNPVFLLFVYVLGSCWGSFLNVCIFRIPAELSVAHPPSRCPKCETRIAPYDNIPVLSWLLLGGKCRTCKVGISGQYPLIEALTGVLFLLIWMHYGFSWLTPVYWLMVFGLLLGSLIDIAEQWIPDRVTWGGILIGLPLSALVPEMHEQVTALAGLKMASLGAAVGFFLLWGVGALGSVIFRKEAMGFGDVKLLGAIGAFLGWQAVLLTIFAASLFGSIIGIGLILLGKQEASSRIPFGPYIALGALTWLFGGDALVDWYLGLYLPPPSL